MFLFHVALVEGVFGLRVSVNQPFWQKSGKQWALQLKMGKPRRAARGQRCRQLFSEDASASESDFV